MRIVSFFSGCGGLDLGFRQAGFDIVWANDSDSAICDTYMYNHPETKLLIADFMDIDPQLVPDCDGFIGGPPCRSWNSKWKMEGLENEHGQLFLKYIDMVVAKQPKFFAFENGIELSQSIFKYVFIIFLDKLDKAGYVVKWKLLDAVDYQVPQNRKNLFIVGFRKNLGVTYEFPAPTCSKPIPLRHAIGDIIGRPTYYKKGEPLLPNPILPNHDLLIPSFTRYYLKGNRRRNWKRPSLTIPASERCLPLHPSSPEMIFIAHSKWEFQTEKENKYRKLSVRECARIQTFPDSFIFQGSDIDAQYKMTGNAVPPRLGFILAKSIKEALADIHTEEASNNQTAQQTNSLDNTILVGYYKNKTHKNLIIKTGIYYVRSDERAGSIHKEDCVVRPKYLLLHHKENAAFYELEDKNPTLADASFLKSIGFTVTGKTYLCFHLKHSDNVLFGTPKYNPNNFAPYFTNLISVIQPSIRTNKKTYSHISDECTKDKQ